MAHQGALIHQQAAGWADRERAQLMALDTIFRLASVSKPIVSTAALVLVAQGKLGLDDDISRWLPDFQPRLADGSAAPITVRQLLSHTAGLSYRFFEADAYGPYAQAGVSDGMDACGITLDENLRRLASVLLLYTPGSAWGYSLATAYVNDTTQPHRLAEGESVSAFEGAVGIRYSPARIFDAEAFPSGGACMVGTARDLLYLLEALRQGGAALLPNALIEEMGRDQTYGLELPNAPGFGFGLGFSVLRDSRLADSPESPGTWRWGGAYGHAWFVDRARGLSVVAFTNTLYEGMSGRFVIDLRDAVYGALGEAQ